MTETRHPRRAVDDHLLSQMAKYGRWVSEGLIPAGSRVVPVRRPLEAYPWIMPTSQALSILEGTRTIAVGECVCRSHYGRCDYPLDVCLLLDQAAEAVLVAGKARPVSASGALDILDRASENGLVHLAVYSPNQPLLSLCSCCPCCCYQLGMLLTLGRGDIVIRSDYEVVHDPSRCDGCGGCAARCHFGAIEVGDFGLPVITPERCYGCGLCAAGCHTGASSLALRADRPASTCPGLR